MSRRGENIYKRKDQRWEGRYIKSRRENGKIQYGYVYGYTYKDTKEKLLLKKYEYGNIPKSSANHYYSGNVATWSQFCLEKWKPSIKVSTYNTYQYKLAKYVFPHLGNQLLEEVKSTHIKGLVEYWENLKLSSRTIHLLFQLVRRLFKYAIEKEMISHNPCLDVSLPKQEVKKITPLSLLEQRRLEAVAKREKNGETIILALHMGLRIGEISALKWENIDFDKKILHVKETYQRLNNSEVNTTLALGSAKTHSSNRVIPLTDQMLVLLRNLKKSNRSSFVFQVKGKPMEPRLVTYYFHKIRAKAGLNHIHFHQLRHTFATRLLESKVTISSISELLGHRSTQMTLDVYAGTVLDEKYSSLKVMEQAI